MSEATNEQFSVDHLELWLSDPITKAVMQCANKLADDIQMQAGYGMADSSNAHMTQSLMHGAMGQQDALRNFAANPQALLDQFGLINYPTTEDEEDDDEEGEY